MAPVRFLIVTRARTLRSGKSQVAAHTANRKHERNVALFSCAFTQLPPSAAVMPAGLRLAPLEPVPSVHLVPACFEDDQRTGRQLICILYDDVACPEPVRAPSYLYLALGATVKTHAPFLAAQMKLSRIRVLTKSGGEADDSPASAAGTTLVDITAVFDVSVSVLMPVDAAAMPPAPAPVVSAEGQGLGLGVTWVQHIELHRKKKTSSQKQAGLVAGPDSVFYLDARDEAGVSLIEAGISAGFTSQVRPSYGSSALYDAAGMRLAGSNLVDLYNRTTASGETKSLVSMDDDDHTQWARLTSSVRGWEAAAKAAGVLVSDVEDASTPSTSRVWVVGGEIARAAVTPTVLVSVGEPPHDEGEEEYIPVAGHCGSTRRPQAPRQRVTSATRLSATLSTPMPRRSLTAQVHASGGGAAAPAVDEPGHPQHVASLPVAATAAHERSKPCEGLYSLAHFSQSNLYDTDVSLPFLDKLPPILGCDINDILSPSLLTSPSMVGKRQRSDAIHSSGQRSVLPGATGTGSTSTQALESDAFDDITGSWLLPPTPSTNLNTSDIHVYAVRTDPIVADAPMPPLTQAAAVVPTGTSGSAVINSADLHNDAAGVPLASKATSSSIPFHLSGRTEAEGEQLDDDDRSESESPLHAAARRALINARIGNASLKRQRSK